MVSSPGSLTMSLAKASVVPNKLSASGMRLPPPFSQTQKPVSRQLEGGIGRQDDQESLTFGKRGHGTFTFHMRFSRCFA